MSQYEITGCSNPVIRNLQRCCDSMADGRGERQQYNAHSLCVCLCVCILEIEATAGLIFRCVSYGRCLAVRHNPMLNLYPVVFIDLLSFQKYQTSLCLCICKLWWWLNAEMLIWTLWLLLYAWCIDTVCAYRWEKVAMCSRSTAATFSLQSYKKNCWKSFGANARPCHTIQQPLFIVIAVYTICFYHITRPILYCTCPYEVNNQAFMILTFKLISSHKSFLSVSKAFLTFYYTHPGLVWLPSLSCSSYKKRKRGKKNKKPCRHQKPKWKFCQALPPPQMQWWTKQGDFWRSKGTFNEQALYWSMDKTVVNYVWVGI